MAKIEKGKENKVTKINRDQEQYKKRRNEALKDVDILKMYFMYPYDVTDKIKIYQPTVGQILRFGDNGQYGEKEFYSSVNVFVSNTTSYRLQLWDMGIDWNKISDYELFTMLINGINDDVQKILFGDVNLKVLKPYAVKKSEQENQNEKDNEQELKTDDVNNTDNKNNNDTNKKNKKEKQLFVLYDPEQDIELDESAYTKMANYMRVMFNIFPKSEFAKGKSTKEDLIREEREKLLKHKDEQYSSMLFPMISACLNHPGFKYKLEDLKDLGIVAFMDSVQRLQTYENSIALLNGSFSGFVDMKGVKSDEFNFMKDMYK